MVEWVNPAEKRAGKNSSTVTNGQLTGSSWQSVHHEVKSLNFRVYSFIIEGALDSTTSVERPVAMSCSPSGATPTASTTPTRGERSWSSPVRGGYSILMEIPHGLELEGAVRCLMSCKQIYLSLAKTPPYLLHNLGVKHPFPGLSPYLEKDVCSHIQMPRNMNRS